MSVTFDLAPEVEQLARAKAEAKGLPLEEYLLDVLIRALQQEEWDATEPNI